MSKGFKFSELVTDKKLEDDGVWMEFPDAPGFKVLVARMGNTACQAYMRKLRKPHLRQIRKGTISEKDSQKILREAVAKHVLLDWEGLVNDKDEIIEYSTGKALELFEQSGDFFSEIVDLAGERDFFKAEEVEEASKNLPDSSSGD